MLGSCFLSLLQVQSQFLMSSADLTASLGGFHEIGDYLRDREVTLALKDATATWLSLAQVCQLFNSNSSAWREDVYQVAKLNFTYPLRAKWHIRPQAKLKQAKLKPWRNGDASRRKLNLSTDLRWWPNGVASVHKYDDASCKKSHLNAPACVAIQY